MISVSFYFGEIHLPAFQAKFGVSLEQAFPAEIAFLLARGLMKYTYETNGEPLTLRLTEAGVTAYNGVIALFYAGAIKQHLLDLAAQQADSESFNVPVFSGDKAHV
jgi:hypothetical protein